MYFSLWMERIREVENKPGILFGNLSRHETCWFPWQPPWLTVANSYHAVKLLCTCMILVPGLSLVSKRCKPTLAYIFTAHNEIACRGHAWQGVCMAGEGKHASRGDCMVGDAWQGHVWQGAMHGRGCARQEKQQLQWAVCILLECILVTLSCERNKEHLIPGADPGWVRGPCPPPPAL